MGASAGTRHFPELAEITGETAIAERRAGQSLDTMRHNVRLWKAALAPRQGNQE